MKVSQLASTYAKSIYALAAENRTQERVLADLRALDQAFAKEPEITAFLSSPLVSTEDREQALKSAMAGSNATAEVQNLVLLLARNGRFAIFAQVVEAFQEQIDEANGVGRGTVRSAVALGPAERQQIETIVEKVLKKKVILTYKVDPTVIGGLVAQVGSYTFDDSLDSHLRRMNEELKRRAL